MVGQRKDKPRFAGWIEQLEDRRLMSADPLLDLLPPVDQFAGDPPPVEQTSTTPPPVDQHVLGTPDFWIDPSDDTDLDAYFGQIDQMITQAHNLTGWFNVQNNYGFTGRGQTVAVIDSGIAWDHFALGGGLGANYRVVGGWDFTESDGNPYDDGPSGSHGSHVSGIIGNNSSSSSGVAPGVDFVGLRVFDDAGQGFFSWIENALQWVHDNRNSFANPITAVNLSLGVSGYNSETIPAWANLEEEFAQLKADGIFIAVSAGNSYGSFNTPGLSYPAASQYVVPVMSVNNAGAMSSFSQRLTRAIAAPGEGILSTVPDYNGNNNGVTDDFGTKSGTSMAAPYIAGASVLIRQAMQFVGMTNITQDTIYNHMMATADSFGDGSGNTYKRLNLARAIDSLMPADDYGSTAGAAYNMGSMSGPMSRGGKIGNKTDVDCFTFTAAASGKVTFSANCTMGMAPSWQVWGATALPSAAGTLAFNVVAGQSYTIGLSTSTCVGNYTLASTLDTSQAFTFTDWGSASYNEVNDLAVAGEKWYRVQATRSGTITAVGAFNAAAGSVNVALYNSNLQLIVNGTTAGGQARVDVAATNGNYYFLKVTGSNADVDFKVANLVSQSAGTVTVAATSGADEVIFSTGAFHWLSVNGVSYGFALGAANRINFDGGGGADTMYIYGSSGAEAYTLRQGSATLVSSALTMTAANVESQFVSCNGGGDTMDVADSIGDDVFHVGAGAATLFFANGEVTRTWGFSFSVMNSTAGNDRVDLYDTLVGNETVNLWAGRALLTGNGYFSNDVRGFDVVAAHASGGNDRVNFYDSAGADTFAGWSDHATMSCPGFVSQADGFDQMSAASSSGGADVANLYDSAGNDNLQLYARSATFTYAGGVSSATTGFAQVLATSAAGYDFVDLYDTAANDTISLWSDRSLLVGGGCTNDVRGFDLVTARYQAGGADVVTLYDSVGDDYLQMNPRYAKFEYASGATTIALGFNQALAVSSGGFDGADLFDSRGNDVATLWSDRAIMTGANFANEVRGFDVVWVLAWYGGTDQATFYDSTGDDAFSATPDRATMSGLGFSNVADKFEQTLAIANAGGFDTATLFDSAANDTVLAELSDMAIRGAGFDNLARGFDEVNARLINGGQNKLTLRVHDYIFNTYGSYVV